MNLNIEKFNPTKADLIKLADKYKSLEIKGIDDRIGYNIVDEARKDLKKKRVELTKTGKELRDEANQFAKKVISIEKELVAIIEPLELELKAKQDEIDLIIEKNKRKALLPDRIEKLKSINVEISEDEILEMDSDTFLAFFNEHKEYYLAEKERKLQEEKDKIEEQKKIEELKKQREEEIERAKKEAAENAKKEAEEHAKKIQAEKDAETARKIKEAEDKAKKAEEDRIRADLERKLEDERKEKEEQERIEKEKQEKAALEKEKKYKQFLKDNGVTAANKDNFIIKKVDEKILLFKKIGELNL